MAKAVPSFLSHFRTLSIGRAPGIEPATPRSFSREYTIDPTSTAVSSEIISIGTRPYFRKPFVALNDKKERLGLAGCSRILSENAS